MPSASIPTGSDPWDFLPCNLPCTARPRAHQDRVGVFFQGKNLGGGSCLCGFECLVRGNEWQIVRISHQTNRTSSQESMCRRARGQNRGLNYTQFKSVDGVVYRDGDSGPKGEKTAEVRHRHLFACLWVVLESGIELDT